MEVKEIIAFVILGVAVIGLIAVFFYAVNLEYKMRIKNDKVRNELFKSMKKYFDIFSDDNKSDK